MGTVIVKLTVICKNYMIFILYCSRVPVLGLGLTVPSKSKYGST